MVTQKILEGDIRANITLLRKCIQWRVPVGREIAFKKFSDNKMIVKYLEQGQ